MRRLAGLLAVAAGTVLLTFTFTEHVFSRAGDAETVATHYRGLMSPGGLAELRGGFDELRAAGNQLVTEAQPALQQQLGLDDAQYRAYLEHEMPNVAAFDDQAASVVGLVDPVITTMQRAQNDYHRADQIPVGFLPLDSAPWMFLAAGIALVTLGALVAWRPRRLTVVVLGVLGALLVVAPLALGIPGKVDAAIRVKEVGRTGLAPSTGQAAVGATALFDGVAHDVVTVLEPRLEAAGVDHAGFAAKYPVLEAWVTSWQGSISAKSHDLSDSQVALAPTFANADRIPLRIVPWLFVVPGLLVALLVGESLLRDSRRAQAPYRAVVDQSGARRPAV